jgi:hypothetical protein
MTISNYIVNQTKEFPSLLEIRAYNIEGWVYSVANDQLRNDLRSVVLSRAARHSLIRIKIMNLVLAWNAAGIEPLILKGFAFAELFYEHPHERYYGDVDILVSKAEAPLAMRIAREIGWSEHSSLENNTGVYRHEYGHLFSSDQSSRIDLHTEILQYGRFDKRRLDFCKQISESSIRFQFENGAKYKVPQIIDLPIVLLQNRRCGDRWARKATDYLDIEVLIRKFSITREAILDRAKQLKCQKSLIITLNTCDPWLKKLDLIPTSFGTALKYDFLTMREFGSQEIDLLLRRVSRFPKRLPHFVRVIPVLFMARKAIRKPCSISELVGQFDCKPQHEKQSELIKDHFQIATSWATRIFGPRINPCVPRSLVLLRTLSQEGFAASFVSGVRKVNGKLEGHAWVEVDGLPLESDMQSPNLFKENFRYDNWLLRQRKAVPKQKD